MMNKFIKSMFNMIELEELARRDLPINRLNPLIKIIMTLSYIILIASHSKYELSQVLILGVYPILILSIADIPLMPFLSKLILPGFLSISLGIFNIFLDIEVILQLHSISISGGVISFLTLLVKSMYSISATLLLVSTTPIELIGKGLRKMKVPSKLIMLLLITYRYINILLKEFSLSITAYQLRGGSSKGIHFKSWGSFLGQIFIRSYQRSNTIYQAMLLRGYHFD